MLVMEFAYAISFLGLVLVLSVIASLVYSKVEDNPGDMKVNCKSCHKRMVYYHYRWVCPNCGKVLK